MIREVLLIHHSHTDIGYTHPQPIIFELHNRFIEEALDLSDLHAEETGDSGFRWTCEVTGTTRIWWNQASNQDRDRFLKAVQRGQFEVAAMEWHLTPLADLRMLVRSLENVKFFRSLGIPVRSAMNTDVNGVPWGLVEVLLDHGINGFSMSSNSHLGAPVLPRPGAFRWASPNGREITAWNGFQYWHVANGLMRIPSSIENVAEALPKVLAEAEQRGFSLPFLPIQITNPHHPDNAGPDPMLPGFVRDWNATNPPVRLRTVLLSEAFDLLRQQELPVLYGDWTDYWNLGAGSSSRETTVLKEGQRVLDAAHQVSAWHGVTMARQQENLDAAHANLSLYAEHTWGADISISSPESIETKMQWATKSAYAFQGLSYSRMVLRDALHGLAQQAGGEEPTYLLYNPLPIPIRVPIRLATKDLDWALTPSSQHRYRLYNTLGAQPIENQQWSMVELPPMGYQTYPVGAMPMLKSEPLSADETSISSDRVSIEFLASGGVRSLKVDEIEYVGIVESFTFGVPILERPTSGSRRDLMTLDFLKFEPADGWHPDFERTTLLGRLVSSNHESSGGTAEFRQIFEMDNRDQLEVLYRLFSGEPTVEVQVLLTSSGESSPYSLALPFTVSGTGDDHWHFDTAGALVEFGKEQLLNACQHYITTNRFVRMQNDTSSLCIATPDLPLWKFGGMFLGPTSALNAADRQSVMLAWLANNYWETNFLANQFGQTRYRFQLIYGSPVGIETSYQKALPFACPPLVHAYRELNPSGNHSDSLVCIEGDHFSLESSFLDGEDLVLIILNLMDDKNSIAISPGSFKFENASLARLDGEETETLHHTLDNGWRLDLKGRSVQAVRLSTNNDCPKR